MNDLEMTDKQWTDARRNVAARFDSNEMPTDDELERFWSARDEAERHGILRKD